MITDVPTRWITNPIDMTDLDRQYARAVQRCHGNGADLREVEAERTFFHLCLEDEAFCVSQGMLYVPPCNADMISLEEFEAGPHFVNQENLVKPFWTIGINDELADQIAGHAMNLVDSPVKMAISSIAYLVLVLSLIALAVFVFTNGKMF